MNGIWGTFVHVLFILWKHYPVPHVFDLLFQKIQVKYAGRIKGRVAEMIMPSMACVCQESFSFIV